MATPPAASDFATPLADLGVSVTYTPVTTTIDNVTGQKTYSDGGTSSITAIWNNPNNVYFLDDSGETKTADGEMFVANTVSINKRDKITFNSNDYRVVSVDQRKVGTDDGYKRVLLFLI